MCHNTQYGRGKIPFCGAFHLEGPFFHSPHSVFLGPSYTHFHALFVQQTTNRTYTYALFFIFSGI